jgi:hypothetical protein
MAIAPLGESGMKVQAKGGGLRITLSRANLKGMLAALDLAIELKEFGPHPVPTLTQRGGTPGGADFYDVVAEEDAAHYGPHTPLAKGGSA